MWKFVSIFSLVLFLTSSNALPVESDKVIDSENQGIPTLATELLPPPKNAEVTDFRNFKTDKSKRTISTELELPKRVITAPFRNEDDTKPTLSLELEPPKESIEKSFYPENKENVTFGAVFIINLYAVKNSSGEDGEVLSDEVAEKYPAMLEPVATILLVLEEDDEKKPLNLDEFAKDLEREGVKVEKISEDGETKVIKVDFDESIEDNDVELIKPGKFNKVRRRRTICSSCHGGGLLSKLLDKHRGGGGGCQGNCGGGYPQQTQTVGVIPVVVVPVQQQRPQYQPPPQQPHYVRPQPHYVQPQPHYVQPQPQYVQPQPQYVQHRPHYVQQQPTYQPSGGCNTCGGGNHGSYSQSSAQASAQSSSGSW